MSDYTGIIIEESLASPIALNGLKILNTTVEAVTPSHKTPWLKYWNMHEILIPEKDMHETAQRISRSFDNHTCWYADFKNDTRHYIIFPGKIFNVDRSKPQQYEAVRAYGVERGIPEKQLDFSPQIN